MTPRLLAVRVNRRAIGVALLADEQVEFADGRYLTSNAERVAPAVARFLERTCGHARPTMLVLDAPPVGSGASTDHAVAAIRAAAAAAGLPTMAISRTQVLAAFSVAGLRNRNEVRDVVESYWPGLADRRGAIRPYLLDAAAAALLAEFRATLEPLPT